MTSPGSETGEPIQILRERHRTGRSKGGGHVIAQFHPESGHDHEEDRGTSTTSETVDIGCLIRRRTVRSSTVCHSRSWPLSSWMGWLTKWVASGCWSSGRGRNAGPGPRSDG